MFCPHKPAEKKRPMPPPLASPSLLILASICSYDTVPLMFSLHFLKKVTRAILNVSVSMKSYETKINSHVHVSYLSS